MKLQTLTAVQRRPQAGTSSRVYQQIHSVQTGWACNYAESEK